MANAQAPKGIETDKDAWAAFERIDAAGAKAFLGGMSRTTFQPEAAALTL